MSCPTHKSPEVSSPAAATGTDTGVCKDYWDLDFILFIHIRGNMPKKKGVVKSENKFLFEIRTNAKTRTTGLKKIRFVAFYKLLQNLINPEQAT